MLEQFNFWSRVKDHCAGQAFLSAEIGATKVFSVVIFGAICCNFWVFFVIFGCKILGFKNPASVKEMTNMRYVQE